MASREYVRTLTVRSREEGAAQVTRSLHAVADAQQRVVRTTEEGARVVDMTASKLASAERGWGSLTSRLEGNTSAYRNFIRESNAARQALDTGLTSVDRYKEVVRQLREELQAAGTSRFGFNVDQSGVNALLGVRTKLNNSARESASVFEEEARLMDALQVKASRLRAELDPLGAAYERLNAEIASHQQLADRQLISQDQLAQATVRSRQAFDDTASSMKAVNDNSRLTANQVQNLGFQLNDATTMLLSGSSPFQVLATQGGQVVQALQENGGIMSSLRALGAAALEAGVKGTTGLTAMATAAQAAAAAGTAAATSFTFSGAIAGIASLVRMVNPAVVAIGAMATASAYLWWNARDATGDAEKAAESYRTAVEGVKRSYGELGTAIDAALEKQLRGSANLASARTAGSITVQRASLQSGLDSLRDIEGFGPSTSTIGGIKTLLNMADPAIASMQEFYSEVLRGQRTVAELQETVAQIRLDPTTSDAAKKIADEILKLSENARLAEANIAALQRAALELKGVRLAEFSKQLDEFIPDTKLPADRINEIADAALQQARSMGEVYQIERKRKAGLDELARVEDHRRTGYELDVRAITARSAAERGQIEYERTYADVLAETNDKAQAARQAEEARSLVLKQSAYEQTEAMNDRIRAGQAQVDQLRLEIDTFGKSAGEIARLTTETQLLTAAREAARQAGGIVDPAEEQAIRDQAAAIGQLTDRQTRLNLDREQSDYMLRLQAEGVLLYANEDARRVAIAGLEAEAELRRQGIPLNDAWSQSYVQNAREMATMEVALDKQRDAFEGLRDAVGDFFSSLASGKDVLESLGSAFGRLASDLASKGFDQIFGGLFGSGGQTGTSGGGLVGSLGNVPIPTPRPAYNAGATDRTFSAPVAAVERRVLPALSSFSTELTAAAKAIRTIESGSAAGNYSALGPVTRTGDRAYGAYQVMGANIPEWSKAAIGRVVSNVEFLGSPSIQDAVFKSRFGDRYATKYGMVGASQAWFAGEGGMRNLGAKDIVGTSVSGYAGKFGSLYERHLGSNVASSTSDAKIIERASATGTEKGVKRAVESYDAGRFDGSPPQGADGLFGQRGMAGFNVLGAGIGAFSNGYASGSPLSGGIGGIFTGLGASQSIATAFPGLAGIAGPVGAIGGLALGVLGGILGKRAQRKAAHQEAAARWEQMRPQYEAFDKSLSGDGNGQLRQWITEQEGQFAQFRKVGGDAWKYGSGNSTEQFASTGTKMWTRFMEMQAEFREGFTDMVEDLSSGEGLGGAFAKGRAATKDLKKQIKDMVDDVSIAFGSSDIGVGVSAEWEAASKTMEEQRNKAIAEAKTAAGEYALSLLYTAQTSSEVEKSLDGFRGTAAGLQKILTDLGWTAEKTAADIDERLTQAIAKMAETFVDGFQRQINDLSDLGYLNDLTDLIKARDEALSDAALLGVDPSIVSKWFDLAAQDIVDGAELTGDAFDDLIKAFPALADVVKAFVDETAAVGMTIEEIGEALNRAAVGRYETAVRERADAEAALRTEYERTVDRIAGIKDFLSDMALDDNLSTLDGKGQFDEAQRLYRETLFKANGGDQEAQDKLLGVTQDYLDEAKAYYATSEKYGEVYREIEATLKASASRMETELDVARRQASFLEEIAGGTKGLSALLEKYLEADKAVGGSLADLDANRAWGIRPVANRKNVSEFRAAGLPEYTGNFGPDTWPQIEAWLNTLSMSQRAQAMAIMTANNAIGYASGGYTGMGGVNEVAGMVHRGEVVWSQDDVRAWGGPARVDAMRVARMPEMPMMQPARNDNRDLVAALGRVESLLRLNIQTTGQGLQRVAVATEEGARSSRQKELATRRASNLAAAS